MSSEQSIDTVGKVKANPTIVLEYLESELRQAVGKWPLEEWSMVKEFIQAAPREAKVRAGEVLSESASTDLSANWGITEAIATLLPKESVMLPEELKQMVGAQNGKLTQSSLQLDFRFNNFTDIGLKVLAQKLSPDLRSLQLDFSCNHNFTDAGLRELAKRLSPNLTLLQLNFGLNQNITDAGLNVLAKNLAPKLTSLQLNFECNGNFTDAGLKVLAENLSPKLTWLELNFGENKNFTDAGLRHLAQNLAQSPSCALYFRGRFWQVQELGQLSVRESCPTYRSWISAVNLWGVQRGA